MAYQSLTLRQVAAAIREEQASPDGDPWLRSSVQAGED
jgi:hypothetical protein